MPRTGRPKSVNPKDIQLKIRIDAETARLLDYCAKVTGKTKSDIVRLGIEKVRLTIDGEK